MSNRELNATPNAPAAEGKGILAADESLPTIKKRFDAIGVESTEGLDGLRDHLQEYRRLGARFAKWRAVITIGTGIPARWCIESNAHALARYAALCREAGLVPIVEPEVLMDGDHTIERCEEVTSRTLMTVFSLLHEHRVEIDGMLLKPNMVVSGKDCPSQAGPEDVALATLRCFAEILSPALPGVMFLSGGQSPIEATMNLNAMNVRRDHPWELSFSYGRALQEPVLKAWGGDPGNVSKAQAAFLHRAKCNGAARYGTYSQQMESEAP